MNPRPPEKYQRTCHKYRRIRTDQNAYEQCKREIEKNRPSQDEQGNQDEQYGKGCNERSAQHLVDTDVYDASKVGLRFHLHHILPDPVKDDDRVRKGIAGDGEKGRDEKDIHFEAQKIE